MRRYMVEILADFFVLMVFFYRRFLPLDVCIYAFGAENDDSSSNLPIPFVIFGKTEKDQIRPKLNKKRLKSAYLPCQK